jgi:Protein of unknown function (DUF2752)
VIGAGTVALDTGDARIAGGLMLGCAALRPLVPGEPGLACPLRTLTGVPCPLCGMTTSVTAAVQLDLAGAIAANPAGLVAVVSALIVLLRPRARLAVPAIVLYSGLAAMWIWELHRFSIV